MKEYPSADPKMGPTEDKKPGDLHFDHHMLKGAEAMAPGDRVKLIVHGHVHSNASGDQFGPGHVHIHIHNIEEHPEQDGQKPVKKPNASEMRMSDLKKKITDLTENDENMEGHSESGVKEKGEDE
jgi:hypothetical protein